MVAVEEARDRREAPVHHPDAALAIDEGVAAEAVVAPLLALADAQVREVRGGRLGELVGTGAVHHRAEQPHLLEDGGEVLRRRLERLLAEVPQAPHQVALPPQPGPSLGQGALHRDEERLLLQHHRALIGAELRQGGRDDCACAVAGQVDESKGMRGRPHAVPLAGGELPPGAGERRSPPEERRASRSLAAHGAAVLGHLDVVRGVARAQELGVLVIRRRSRLPQTGASSRSSSASPAAAQAGAPFTMTCQTDMRARKLPRARVARNDSAPALGPQGPLRAWAGPVR